MAFRLVLLITIIIGLNTFSHLHAQVVETDTIPPDSALILRNIGDTTIVDKAPVDTSRAQVVIAKDSAAASADYHDPKKAYIRSLILPGWGQVYNGSVWKVPVIYTGFGVLTYFIISNHKNYKEFQQAYLFRTDDDAATIDEYVGVITDGGLLELREYYRRNRDFTVILTAVWYALNVIDAYVEAHLKGFDVSDDLTLRIRPGLISPPAGSYPAAGITLGFTLNK